MDNSEIMVEQILQRAEQLSPEAQQAFCLLIQNLDIIDELPCDFMTFKDKERYVLDALQRKDYLLAMIVEYKWLEQEREKE